MQIMILTQISSAMAAFIEITFQTDAVWTIIPLVISTFLLMIYSWTYKEEKANWDANFSNSLVLIFVSIALFKHIYEINNAGAFNFVNVWGKTLITILLLYFGLFIIKFNFEHLLPIKIARYISSPISVNLGAYLVILLVYSTQKIDVAHILALSIIILVLVTLLILIKLPADKIKKYMEQEKKKERLNSIKEEKFEIKELRKSLDEREKELKIIELKKLKKEEKEAIRLEKAIKK